MKKWICVCVAAMMLVSMSACHKKKHKKTPVEPTAVTTPVTTPAAAVPGGAPGTVPAAATVAAPTDPNHQKLIGTHWMVGDFDVTFQDAQTLMVKGGPLAQTAPNGLAAKYSYENGILKVIAMGQAKTGTWDGTKLVVDGKEGVRQSQ